MRKLLTTLLLILSYNTSNLAHADAPNTLNDTPDTLNISNNVIKSVTPDFVKMRHSETLQIEVAEAYKQHELSVVPGGIFIEQQHNVTAEKFELFWRVDQPELISNQKTMKHDLSLPDDFTQFAENEHQLAIAEQRSIAIYNKNSMQLEKQITLNADIQHMALSNNQLCIVLSNNTLLHSSLTNDEQYTTNIDKDTTMLAAANTQCVTANQTNQIFSWTVLNQQLVENGTFTLNNRPHKIIAQDKQLLIANGDSGLTVLEIINNTLQWKSSYNKLGNIINLSNEGSQVLVADDEGILTLLDISGDNRPLLISDFFLNKKIHSLIFKHEKAYVTTRNQLITINFSAQSTPLISTLGVNQGGSRRSFIDQDILYVADWFSGLHLYDISQAHLPKLISSFHTPGSPKGVLVRDGIAYVADDDHGLQIIDVSIPQELSFISNLPLTGLAYTMKLRDNILYLASHYGGFHLIDVSNTRKPSVISTVNTSGKPWALALKGNELYVADDQSGILVFDISKPATPQLISQFNPGGFAEDIVIRGDRAYLAFFDAGIFILDISDAKNIKILSQLKTPGSARGIDIHADILYLAAWEAGVVLVDISNESMPRIISQFDTNGATWGVSAKNDKVYAMDWWGGVKIIDAKQPHQLRQIAKYQTAGKINDIVLQKNFLYTAHGARGLQIYESSNALNPVWASGVDIMGNARSLAVNKQLAVIASEASGINIIDISNPFQPRWLSNLELRKSIVNVALNNNSAVALAHSGEIFIIDITRPEFPEVETQLASDAAQIALADNSLWLLTKRHQIQQIDLSKQQSKQQRTATKKAYTLSQAAIKFARKDNTLIVAQKDNRLVRYSMNDDHIVQQSAITLAARIIDIALVDDLIYVTTDNRTLNVIKNRQVLQLVAQYPSIHHIENIVAENNNVYFSGESLIASGQLLPALTIRQSKTGFTLDIPDNMPLGSYHLALTGTDGSQQISLNAFEIGFPKFKPKFSMEDLKKKLQEKNFSGKAPIIE